MIYLYPANKMENLLVLFDKIQQISPLSVLSQEVVIVQNAGMQHWLNLSLARQRGISMNMRYALPAQYLWKLIRSLASDENVPDQSPYSREVLTWRIDGLLTSDAVINSPVFAQPTAYWRESNQQQATLKRFQLAGQLADLYEQYLIFRPDWLDAWQSGASLPGVFDNSDSIAVARWQAELWLLLLAQLPYNPKTLLEDAIANLATHSHFLPTRLSFFGINALAPMWLNFIAALSAHIEVHFFHLNPCFAYWGDILSEKQAAKTINRWTDGYQQISAAVGNPLLANLGQQGREFLGLLQSHSTINIDVFERASQHENVDDAPVSVLLQLQHDILQLQDGRAQPQQLVDDSITVTSAHSALREVQGLHDWLLHQFNQEPTLTPKDILVMCPQVEDYAPYIDAVFSRGWQELDDKIPPLPCSIADRVSKDSEPLVAAFIELLTLPDSRFQVSQIISFLRLPAMQIKFGLSFDELEKISQWLEQASIHWGIDSEHKKAQLNMQNHNANFTWQQGLSRLLLGFAYGDDAAVYDQQLLLPMVEGDSAILLGKVLLILEQLQYFATQLSTDRAAIDWLNLLNDMLYTLFDADTDPAINIITQATGSLVEYNQQAHYQGLLSLAVVREFLSQHFSQPDPGRQFWVGQVTFCSLMPMRSIPFKIIAVLGLNDGKFPRQRQPLGFDLMAMTAARLGDRSRRGDDRYLFLEALICTREKLYLSYQGRNIRTNAEQQPSLILKELMTYLQDAYGWSLIEPPASQLRQLPMQPFSERNYQQQYPSFDAKWLAIAAQAEHTPQALVITGTDAVADCQAVSAEQLLQFFTHPAKYFARAKLNLNFADYAVILSDVEPFVSGPLESYLLKQQLLTAELATAFVSESPSEPSSQSRNDIDERLLAAQLSGKFPDSPLTALEFSKWHQDSEQLSHAVLSQHAGVSAIDCHIVIDYQGQAITVSAKLPVSGDSCVLYRSSRAKAKDFLLLYLHQLICQLYQQQHPTGERELLAVRQSVGFYFDTKKQQVMHYGITDIANPQQKLQTLLHYFFTGQQQALLLNGEIAERMFRASQFGQQDFEKLWTDSNNSQALGDDPYLCYFWQTCPQLDDFKQNFIEVYQGLYQVLAERKL